ncbi:hypothetical protein OXPF_10280 [Oxobacter pfennigii]|uniref:Uncharacterized protein n=1 Tax=Oxobacter pfennigii TaxID=36849 RepID=A0A0P9AIV7_9CLOT|nr:hypothetical protein [Oxobacter pfennigii]KPU45381.1 hypothetical protein OXPF_10280 [Oxobacter pfennigii]
MYCCPFFICSFVSSPIAFYKYPEVIVNSPYSYPYMYRKKKKDIAPNLQQTLDIINCFNPSVYNTYELKCIAAINTRKFIRDMLDIMIKDSHTYKKKYKKKLKAKKKHICE